MRVALGGSRNGHDPGAASPTPGTATKPGEEGRGALQEEPAEDRELPRWRSPAAGRRVGAGAQPPQVDRAHADQGGDGGCQHHHVVAVDDPGHEAEDQHVHSQPEPPHQVRGARQVRPRARQRIARPAISAIAEKPGTRPPGRRIWSLNMRSRPLSPPKAPPPGPAPKPPMAGPFGLPLPGRRCARGRHSRRRSCRGELLVLPPMNGRLAAGISSTAITHQPLLISKAISAQTRSNERLRRLPGAAIA